MCSRQNHSLQRGSKNKSNTSLRSRKKI